MPSPPEWSSSSSFWYETQSTPFSTVALDQRRRYLQRVARGTILRERSGVVCGDVRSTGGAVLLGDSERHREVAVLALLAGDGGGELAPRPVDPHDDIRALTALRTRLRAHLAYAEAVHGADSC